MATRKILRHMLSWLAAFALLNVASHAEPTADIACLSEYRAVIDSLPAHPLAAEALDCLVAAYGEQDRCNALAHIIEAHADEALGRYALDAWHAGCGAESSLEDMLPRLVETRAGIYALNLMAKGYADPLALLDRIAGTYPNTSLGAQARLLAVETTENSGDLKAALRRCIEAHAAIPVDAAEDRTRWSDAALRLSNQFEIPVLATLAYQAKGDFPVFTRMAGAFLSGVLLPLLGSEHAALWEHRNDREFLTRSMEEESTVSLFAALQMLGLGVRDADTEALRISRQFLAAYCENATTPPLDSLLAAEAASAFVSGVYKSKPGEAWTPHLRGMAEELTALALDCAERQASGNPATLETRAYLQHAAKRYGQEFRFLGEKRCHDLLVRQFPDDPKVAEWMTRLASIESDVWGNHHESARIQREVWTGRLPAEEQGVGILREINYLYFSGDYPATLALIRRAGLLSSKQQEREASRVLEVLCLFRQGKLDEAGKIANDFIEHRDQNGPWYGHMLLLRAYLLMLEGKRVEAAAVAARVQPGQLDDMRLRKVQEMLDDVVQGAGGAAETEGARAAKTLPNIMLISLDTVRPDHLGCYGYKAAHTPNIDALAAGGVVFERAYSTSSWTKPSHASVFTGLYPLAHGAQGHMDQVAPKAAVLPEMLGGLGYTTLGTISAPPLNSIFGFARGFDWYDDFTYDFDRQCNLFLRGNGGPVKIHSGSTGNLVTQAAMLAWERRDPTLPFFQFVNYFDAHHNYQPPYPWSVDICGHYHGNEWGVIDPWLVGAEPFDPIKEKVDVSRLKSLYDAEIAAVDAEVGAWVKRLKEEGKFDSTLWVLFGDHGEEFLEHGGLAHGRSLNEEVIRVPLIFAGPGLDTGTRVADAVSLVDLAPTLLELLGKDAPAGLDGISLAPALRGAALPKRALFAGLNLAEFQGYAIIDGTEKLILNSGANENACYNLEADPAEASNLATQDPGMADRLAALAVRHQDQQRQLGLELGSGAVLPAEQVPSLDELVEQLRAMGYLGT